MPLVELERMTDELAGFAAKLPERYRYSVMSALRQTLAAGVRYGYLTINPAVLAGPNPMPAPRTVRTFTPELPLSALRPQPAFVPPSGRISNAATSTALAA